MTGPDSQNRRPRERSRTYRNKAKRKQPARLRPTKPEEPGEGLSLAKVLRDCLASTAILVDDKQRVAPLNDRAKQLLGIKLDRVTPLHLAALPAPVRTMVREALASGKSPADRQIELKTGSGGTVVLRLSAVPVPMGRRKSVVVVLNDLTPARRIEQHIQQLDRLASIGTLATGTAHEIKNALVAGKTFVDLLLEKHQDTDLAEVVRREIGRIDTLVSEMRKFAGSARPTFSEVHLHEVLDHSLRLVQPRLQGKLVSLNRAFQASRDALHGNDYRLQQAFVNLFLNAVEAMGPNGTLSVATDLISAGPSTGGPRESGDRSQLRLTIKDNGIGIAPEHVARLFEPFFTTKPDGTGLGLLITRRIIQEHHGTISVQSEPQKGTAFQILLPALA